MSKKAFFRASQWSEYSQKLKEKIVEFRCAGFFSAEEKIKEMRLVTAQEGGIETSNAIAFYLLIDEQDGVIADAKFQVFGPPLLIGIAEAVSELVIRKTYEQALRINADYIEKYLKESNLQKTFARELGSYINLALSTLEEALATCIDIPLENPFQTPLQLSDFQGGEESPLHFEFLKYSIEEKKRIIEQVMEEDIRPFIALDAGGVEIIDIKNDCEVVIRYQGSCVSCYSATGATLDSIQGILRLKVHPSIRVIPDLSLLQQ